MKKNNGISLIVLMIIVILVVMAACVVAGVIIGMNKSKQQTVINNTVENTTIIEENTIEENVVENKQEATNTVDDKNQVEELKFDKEFLQSGQSYGNVDIIENALENTVILSITGASENDISEFDKVSTKNRWYKSIDLTDYTTLQFYARKGEADGDLMVCIDNTLIKRIRFNEFNSTWTKYTIDVSRYKGNHTIAFAGGYADNTGSPNSNTQYRSIKLK